ncbi:MAG TPA: hypothetical protein VGR84_11085 [Candidatus Acidoferrales bacterium]|nr:hypothetical protein [Candidatus Acidoferrales bacterium]
MAVSTTKMPAGGARSRSTSTSLNGGALGATQKKSRGQLSDDEILGLVTAVSRPGTSTTSDDGDANADNAEGNDWGAPGSAAAQAGSAASADSGDEAAGDSSAEDVMTPEVAKLADANPQLAQTLADAQAYRAVFASPGAAQDAKNQLEELDGMFFSGRPSDHAALAARMHELSPEAFQNFAKAVQAHAAKVNASAQKGPGVAASADSAAGAGNSASLAKPEQLELFPSNASDPGSASSDASQASGQLGQQGGQQSSAGAAVGGVHAAQRSVAQAAPIQPAAASANDPRRAAQVAFFHDTNAAAVEQILGTTQAQVKQLLPDSVPTGTRNRIIGEVYRELDSTLRANRQLGKQLREAFQAGARDAAHQRAIVTLVAGRAKQALPAVAKRVIGEWTQSIVAANHERLSRHEAASKRVDIAGAGASDGVNRKLISPRDVNYRRLSDADILNL